MVSQRCLVFVNGFYKWQWLNAKGKEKQKYKLSPPDEDLFAFAGLYSHWTDTSTGEIKNTYTILSREANLLMAEIQNHKKRMPVILNKEEESKWLQRKFISHFAFPYSVDLVATKRWSKIFIEIEPK